MSDSEHSGAAPTPLEPREGVPQLSEIIMKARSSWLKNTEVVEILQNYKTYKLRLCSEPPVQPTGGTLYVFDRKQCRFFRKDGHNWRKKPDGKTVRETHEKLKVGNSEVLNCYYAHADQDDGLQRRCYWLLDEAQEHIVLVHYLNCATSRVAANLPTRPSYSDFALRNGGRGGSGGGASIPAMVGPRGHPAVVPPGLPLRPGAAPPPGYMYVLPMGLMMRHQAAAHAAAQRAVAVGGELGVDGGEADGSLSLGGREAGSMDDLPSMEGSLPGGALPLPAQYGLPSLQQQYNFAYAQQRLPPHALGGGGGGSPPYPPSGPPPPPLHHHHHAGLATQPQQAAWHHSWAMQQAGGRGGYEGGGELSYMGQPGHGYQPSHPHQQPPYPGPPPPHAAGPPHLPLPPYRGYQGAQDGESLRTVPQQGPLGRLSNLEDSLAAFITNLEQSMEAYNAQQAAAAVQAQQQGRGGGRGGGTLQAAAVRRQNSMAKLLKEWEESSGFPLSQLTGGMPLGTTSVLEATISALQEGSFPSLGPDFGAANANGGSQEAAGGGIGRPTDLREIFRLASSAHRHENDHSAGPPPALSQQHRQQQTAAREGWQASGSTGTSGEAEEGGEGSGGGDGAAIGACGRRSGGRGGEEAQHRSGLAGVSPGAAAATGAMGAAAVRGEEEGSEAATPILHRSILDKHESHVDSSLQRNGSGGGVRQAQPQLVPAAGAAAAAEQLASSRQRKQLRPQSSFHSDVLSDDSAVGVLRAAAAAGCRNGHGGGVGARRLQGREEGPSGEAGEEELGSLLRPSEDASMGGRWQGGGSVGAAAAAALSELEAETRETKRAKLQQLHDAMSEGSLPPMINRPASLVEESLCPIPCQAPSPPPALSSDPPRRKGEVQWQPREVRKRAAAVALRELGAAGGVAGSTPGQVGEVQPKLRPRLAAPAEAWPRDATSPPLAALGWVGEPALPQLQRRQSAALQHQPPPPTLEGPLGSGPAASASQALALIQQLDALKQQVIHHLLASGKVIPGEEPPQPQQQGGAQEQAEFPSSRQPASHGDASQVTEAMEEDREGEGQEAAVGGDGWQQRSSEACGNGGQKGSGRGSGSEQATGSKRSRAEEEEGTASEGAEQQPPAARAKAAAAKPPASSVIQRGRERGVGQGRNGDKGFNFDIIDFTPNWDFVSGGAKIIITGTMAGAPAGALCVRFGAAEVEAAQVHPGVLRCTVPPAQAGPGSVRLYVAEAGGGPPASEAQEFEYLPERQAAAAVAPADAAVLAKELVGDKELQLKLIQALLGQHGGGDGTGGGSSIGGDGGRDAAGSTAAAGLLLRPGGAELLDTRGLGRQDDGEARDRGRGRGGGGGSRYLIGCAADWNRQLPELGAWDCWPRRAA